jgi:hypothetical protein
MFMKVNHELNTGKFLVPVIYQQARVWAPYFGSISNCPELKLGTFQAPS